MSVHVVSTNNPDGTWTLAHDEEGHSGDVNPNTLSYGTNPDTGAENRDILVVPCPAPGCGSVSYWPRESLPPLLVESLKA
jgi:hypothetical protein